MPCRRSLLVIHFKYSCVYTSILNSLSLPSLATKSLFLKSVSLLLFHKFICIICFQLLPTRDVIRYFSFSDLLHWVWQSLGSSVLLQTHYFILFNGWVIFHCIYVPHLLYPLLCQWTFRRLPRLDYSKPCSSEHWGACILSDHVFLQIHAQEWDVRDTWQLCFSFLRNIHTVLHKVVPVYIPTNSVGGSLLLWRDILRLWLSCPSINFHPEVSHLLMILALVNWFINMVTKWWLLNSIISSKHVSCHSNVGEKPPLLPHLFIWLLLYTYGDLDIYFSQWAHCCQLILMLKLKTQETRKYQRALHIIGLYVEVSHVELFGTPWTIQSMEFSRSEY